MNRIQQIDPASATGKAKQLLDAVNVKLGIVPNLARVLANAPAALEGYLNFSGALAGGVLSAKVREAPGRPLSGSDPYVGAGWVSSGSASVALALRVSLVVGWQAASNSRPRCSPAPRQPALKASKNI